MSRAAFDDFLRRVKSLQGLPEATAREAAPLVDAALKKNAASGLDPNGKPWPATKKGKRALVHAPDAISTEVRGRKIIAKLEGVETFHHYGVEDGPPQRQILPSPGTMPDYVAEALEQGATKAFNRIMGG